MSTQYYLGTEKQSESAGNIVLDIFKGKMDMDLFVKDFNRSNRIGNCNLQKIKDQ